jgi:long-chain acyl-CoA synthetase
VNVGAITAREAARNGGKTALVDATTGRTATFAELERRVDGLARALTADPRVARGDRIAILAYNCFEYVEVYLAAARAGLLAQGLNWRLAPDELERIVRDAGTRVLIADSSMGELAAELGRRASDIDVTLRFGAGSDGSYDDYVASGAGLDAEPAEPGEDDPVMIIYTGGSTGEPKGAVHTHRSCLTAAMNNTVAERVVPSDRYLMLGQMFHSAAILALNYLLHGATVVLVPRFEPRLALEVIESERVTASLAFPPMINYMLAETDDRRFDLSSLRNMQYGGGPISPRVITEMMDLLPCGLIQCYGSTEHVGVTFLSQEDHQRGRAEERLLRTCGREAYLTQVRLIDAQGRPVPRDGSTPGEIVVRSASNMIGYWRRPDLTAAAMNGGWLGTGDLAVASEDGYLTIVDRVKDLIVSGGENIYPAQVENAIAGHPSVLEVAVVGVPDELWGEAVKAFVVLRGGRKASGAEIRDRVRDTLGSYQKPKHVEFVRELPKSPAGKIAKRELRERSAAGDNSLLR